MARLTWLPTHLPPSPPSAAPPSTLALRSTLVADVPYPAAGPAPLLQCNNRILESGLLAMSLVPKSQSERARAHSKINIFQGASTQLKQTAGVYTNQFQRVSAKAM